MRLPRVVLGLLLLAAVACTGSSSDGYQPPPDSPAVTTIATKTCPKDLQTEVQQNDTPGTGRVLVPRHPLYLVLCGNRQRVVVEDAGQVRAFADALNGLPHGIQPLCYGLPGFYRLFFQYEDGSALMVLVTVPCPTATNGRTNARVDEATVRMIQSALARDPAA